MDLSKISIFTCLLLSLLANVQSASHPSPPLPPTPAPAPAPEAAHVNLTELLSVAGPFSTFLNYLETTKVMDTLQNQANNTDEGLTLFVPKNSAFSSLKKPSLSNLTQDQLKQLVLFHALPHYYSLSDFKNLSQGGAVSTFAGGNQFALNFTDVSGTVHLDSGWTRTKVSSSVISTDPVAVYQVDKVLLPEAIFGTDIPPMPAPAPAPVISPAAADAPAADVAGDSHAPGVSPPNSAFRVGSGGFWSQLVVVVSGVVVVFL